MGSAAPTPEILRPADAHYGGTGPRDRRVLRVEAGRAARRYWSDLFAYRELFFVLAWRDLAVRYKQTAIGVAWAVVRPLLSMIILSVVFGRLAHLPSDGSAPYPVLVYVGMLPWFLVSSILSDASGSLVANANLIGKVYFPRLIVPAACVVVALADFAVSFVLLVALMFYFGVAPDWRIVFLPAFIALAVLASLGPAFWLAAMNVQYRDFRFIVPFLLQFGVYVSPVGFSTSVVPERWRLIYSLNPIVGVIDGFRWCLLGGQAQLHWPGFCASLVMVVLFGVLGIAQFRRMERRFADLL